MTESSRNVAEKNVFSQRNPTSARLGPMSKNPWQVCVELLQNRPLIQFISKSELAKLINCFDWQQTLPRTSPPSPAGGASCPARSSSSCDVTPDSAEPSSGGRETSAVRPVTISGSFWCRSADCSLSAASLPFGPTAIPSPAVGSLSCLVTIAARDDASSGETRRSGTSLAVSGSVRAATTFFRLMLPTRFILLDPLSRENPATEAATFKITSRAFVKQRQRTSWYARLNLLHCALTPVKNKQAFFRDAPVVTWQRGSTAAATVVVKNDLELTFSLFFSP